MIRKESLRIGNLVLYKSYGNKDGEIKTIRGMLDMNAYFERHSNEYGMFHNLEGIPLSADWLKKCGFVIGAGPAGGFYAGENGIAIQQVGNDWWICQRERVREGYQFIRGINFVHELQNLSFAICGQDLKIEL